MAATHRPPFHRTIVPSRLPRFFDIIPSTGSNPEDSRAELCFPITVSQMALELLLDHTQL
jgi:hypothetical protein